MVTARSASKRLGFERPLTTVDVAIFALRDDALMVLLVRRPRDADEPFPDRWALPGGFVDVKKDASLEACAARKLREKTGVQTPYLEQLGSWGDSQRDPRGWSATHAYFALLSIGSQPGNTRSEEIEPPSRSSSEAKWFELGDARRKRLAFDHSRILDAAVERLRSKVEYTSLPAFLLAEPFTLPTLQRTYEAVLGRPMDKSAFRKRMLDAGFLEEAGAVGGTGGRAAMGYRIRDRSQPTVFPRTFRSGE